MLDKMGYNMGMRMIEEFLAKTGVPKCVDFRESVDCLCKVAFKMFVNITPSCSNWSSDGKECSIVLDENPWVENVELPEDCKGLWYSNVLCGIIRGAMEMIHYQVECKFISCQLRGDATTEIKLRLIKVMDEEMPDGDF